MPEQLAAVFLDRDGTVCEEVGYINHLSRCHVYPYAAEAVRALNRSGARTVVISNQSGVARGYFPESLVGEVNEKIRAELEAHGAHIDAFYYCPHHPAAADPRYRLQCACRKPGRGMLDRAVRELNVDLSRSYVIGDRRTDVETAAFHGLRSVLVLTGYGRGEWEYHRTEWTHPPDWVCENLRDGVEIILSGLKSGRGA